MRCPGSNGELALVYVVVGADLREDREVSETGVASCAGVVEGREASDAASVSGEATRILAINVGNSLGRVSRLGLFSLVDLTVIATAVSDVTHPGLWRHIGGMTFLYLERALIVVCICV